MKRFDRLFSISTFAILCVAFAASDVSASGLLVANNEPIAEQSGVGKSEYYPLAEGLKWKYKVKGMTKSARVFVEVTRHEKINGIMCARLEATLENQKKSAEYVRVEKDGIYRYQANSQSITPPLRMMLLPFEDEKTWTINSKTLGMTLKGTFTASQGSITIGGVEYKDVVICKSEDFTISNKKVAQTCWYAKGFGMVKQVIKYGGQEMVLELEKFTNE